MPCRRILALSTTIVSPSITRAKERLGSDGRSSCYGKQEQCDEAGDEHGNDKDSYRRTYKYNPIGILYL